MQLNAPSHASEPIRLTFGGKDSINSLRQLADDAQSSLVADLFMAKDEKANITLARASDRVPVTMLIDPEKAKSFDRAFGATSAQLIPYGEFPHKNHAKALVADSERGVITTGALVAGTRNRWEVTAHLSGDAARALEQLTLATAGGDASAVRSAADIARRFGIVVNDPRAGVRHLTEELFSMVNGASKNLIVATKKGDDPIFQQALIEAHKRGVEVQVLDSTRMPRLHANVVIADGQHTYVGSAHMSKRSLHSSGSGGRLSREMGVVLSDASSAAQILSEMKRSGGSLRAVHRSDVLAALQRTPDAGFLPDEIERPRGRAVAPHKALLVASGVVAVALAGATAALIFVGNDIDGR